MEFLNLIPRGSKGKIALLELGAWDLEPWALGLGPWAWGLVFGVLGESPWPAEAIQKQ